MRVLVVKGAHLLTSMVERLLARENDITVIGLSIQQDSALEKKIQQFQPNVVILDQSRQDIDVASLLEMLKDVPEIRILVLNVNDNFAHIYHKQRVEVADSIDLVAAIRPGTVWAI